MVSRLFSYKLTPNRQMNQKYQVVLALFIIICMVIGYFTADKPFGIFSLKIHPYNCQCFKHKKPVDVPFNRPILNKNTDETDITDKTDNTDKRINVNTDVTTDRSYSYPSQEDVSSEPEVFQCNCGNGRVKKTLMPSLTETPDKLCSECGEMMPYYDRHIHVDCDVCGGKGYYTIP